MVLARTLRRARNITRRAAWRAHDSIRSSYGELPKDQPGFARLIPPDIALPLSTVDAAVVERYLEHRFDLLGSGWTRVGHSRGADPAPLIALLPQRDRRFAADVRALIAPGYSPIDWQLDFKSGHRWSERTWYRDITYGSVPGSDIKVPWELSRLQHLPELGMAYTATRDARFAAEFRNQMLDWIAANPPRRGVNWASAMDVGIRVANVLIAFDLFRAAGAVFDDRFARLLAGFAADHARHIARNLEWAEDQRANHYFGNIGGLFVAGAFLPPSRETNAWLLFGIQELDAEVQRQFLSDGGHFEASTSYHRLCAETAAVCAVLSEAISPARMKPLTAAPSDFPWGPGLRRGTGAFSPAFHERLAAAAGFTLELTGPDGRAAQIGDNDSGRFVRLGGWTQENGQLVSESLDHEQWLGWMSALLTGLDREWRSGAAAVALARSLTVHLGRDRIPLPAASARAVVSHLPSGVQMTHQVSAIREFPGASVREGLRRAAYPQFGAYVFRSRRLYLVIRCGPAVNDGAGVHAHDDQLSIELVIDRNAIVRDPGTFVYTASPTLRNSYRSAAAHAVPFVRGQDEGRDAPPFSPPRIRRGDCARFDDAGFVGWIKVAGGIVQRTVIIHDHAVQLVDDYSLDPGSAPESTDPFEPVRPVSWSPGYGIRLQ